MEADVFLNADSVVWTDELLDNLDGILAHELGHALGLAHPCEPSGEGGAPRCQDGDMPLMHPLYDPAHAELTSDDEAGLCFLYPEGSSDEPAAPAAAGEGCSVSGVRSPLAPPAFMLTMVLAALGLLARRSRWSEALQSSSCSQWS